MTAPSRFVDFGCGAAHLYEYLKRHERTTFSYMGVDASARFIELSRRKFPTTAFHCVDMLADDAALPEADYIVMNGVLTEKRGLSFDEMRDYMARLLPPCFVSARLGWRST